MGKGRSSKNRTREPSDSLTVTLRSGPIIARPIRHLNLSMVDDRRTFDFEPGSRPARLFSGAPATVGYVPNVNKRSRQVGRPTWRMSFIAPSETLVCVRRKRRKEVLFAKKKTGKSGQRKPRRSMWSGYRC